jgi:exonuclease SbcC
MITRIKIEDFQSYQNIEIFPGQTTIIVGRNNSGKTAILRALRLIFFNHPDGSDFVRYGAKNATVEIEYDNHIIKRIKGKQNIYELDGSIYSNFGKDVPQEISTILGFSIIQVDRNSYELNYGSAHEAPFFVSETSATAGKIFSKLGEQVLGDLVLLDKSINASNSNIRKLSTESTVLEKQKIDTLNTLSKYSLLDEIDLDSCEFLIQTYEKGMENLNSIYSIYDELVEIEKSIDFYTKLSDIDIEELEKEVFRLSSIQSTIYNLDKINDELYNLENSIIGIESYTVTEKDINNLENIYIEISNLSNFVSELHKLGDDLRDLEVGIDKANKSLEKVLVDYNNSISEYKEWLLSQKKCPICFKDVDEHDLETILKEIAQ